MIRTSAALACAFALGGCARPRGSELPRPEILLTDRAAPAGRKCVVAERPPSLPGVDAVVDSAALHAAVQGLWSERRLSPGYAILSLAFDENGWNSRRDVIEHDLAPAVADSLQELVFRSRRESAPGEPWGVRLRVDVREAPRFRIGRQELCAARLLDYQDPSLNPVWDTRGRFVNGMQQRTVWARVLVDESGRIADARLEHAGVAGRYESLLLNYVRSLSFAPATVDGIPTPSWMRVPIPFWDWR